MKKFFKYIYISTLSVVLSGCFWKKEIKEIQKPETSNQILDNENDKISEEVSYVDPKTQSTGDAFDDYDYLDEGKNIFESDENINEINTMNSNVDPLTSNHGHDQLEIAYDSMIKMGVVYFDFDKYHIHKTDHSLINQIAQDLKKKIKKAINEELNYRITIKGHACDSAGSERYNTQLSSKRANVIKDLLIEQNIPKTNIETFGCGTSELLVPEGNREEQATNRRAEIYFSILES
jgi:outer membrane protein OmpA-like peptidoglycan-associated protein